MKYCRRLWFQAEIFSNSFFCHSPGSFSLHLFKFVRDEKACAWNCTTFRCIGRIYSVEPNVLDHFGGHCLRCYLSLNNVYNIGIPFYLYGNHVVRCTFSTIRRFVYVFFSSSLVWFRLSMAKYNGFKNMGLSSKTEFIAFGLRYYMSFSILTQSRAMLLFSVHPKEYSVENWTTLFIWQISVV